MYSHLITVDVNEGCPDGALIARGAVEDPRFAVHLIVFEPEVCVGGVAHGYWAARVRSPSHNDVDGWVDSPFRTAEHHVGRSTSV